MLTDRFATTADKLDLLAKEARDDGRDIEAMFLESAAQGVRLSVAEHLAKQEPRRPTPAAASAGDHSRKG
jgi:hypothetical protein